MAIAPLMDDPAWRQPGRPGSERVLRPERMLWPEPIARRMRRSTLRARRRALVLAAVATAAVSMLAGPLGSQGHGATSQLPGVAGTVYRVRPGDTVWSIASRFDRGGDPRPLAEAIARETGSAVVVPGERIAIP